MKKRSPKLSAASIVRLLGSLLAVIMLVYLLSKQEWGDILTALREIPVWRFGAALLLMMVSRLAVALRWHVLLRGADMAISFRQSLRITFGGLFAANFLPTTVGGDVARLAGAVQFKLDSAVSAASLVVDRLVGMAGMAMMIPAGLIPWLQKGGIAQVIPENPVILAGFIPLQRWMEKLKAFLQRLMAALSLWLKRPRALMLALFFTWVHMLAIFSILSILLTGMGESLSFWLIGGLHSLVYFITLLVTLLPISINGLGVQELSMATLFYSVGGISEESRLILPILYRLLMLFVSLPGAVVLPSMLAGRGENDGEAVK